MFYLGNARGEVAYWRAMEMGMGGRPTASFREMQATQLYCPKCGTAMPVRKRLLLVLMDRELHDFICTGCGSPLGKKEEPVQRVAGPR